MRYFEFVSDTWARGAFEWQGEGAILVHLPLLHRLELSETTSGLTGVYAEAVIGLENIFHFLRVDYHMRLSSSEEGMLKNWGIRGGVAAEF